MKKLIRKIRGWLYVRSRQAQTDQLECMLSAVTGILVTALAYAVEARDDTKAEDAKLHIDRLSIACSESMNTVARRINRRENGE